MEGFNYSDDDDYEYDNLFAENKINFMDIHNIINDSQWPEISRFDPVAAAIGIKPGEVAEITRSSPTSLTTKYYRLCK